MKEKKLNKLLVKNMVCQRCILTVESIMQKLDVPVAKVTMGEIELAAPVSEGKLKNIEIE